MDHFETMHTCCGYIEDVHVNFCRVKTIFDKITAFWTLKPPSNFIAGRPKAALLFWFFGGFRRVVPLFIVMLVIY